MPIASRPRPLADDLVGVDEVAHMTGMSKRWVYTVFSNPYKGGIAPMKLGHISKWQRWRVLAWIEQRHEEANGQ